MTALSSFNRVQVEAAARDWFVRVLDEDVRPEELIALERWLDEDPRHRAAYGDVVEAWTQMLQAPAVAAPTAREVAADRYDPRLPVGLWRRMSPAKLRLAAGLVAAALVVAIGAGVAASWPALKGALPQNYATARARQLEAHLQDGSHIRLGGMTTVKVAFSPHHRDVRLAKGEALFQVAHDRTRPFVVHTPFAAITAVGTAFDVDVSSQGVTLTVTDGVVSVRPDQDNAFGVEDPNAESAISVAKGQQLRMERDGARLILALGDGAAGPAWTEGRLEYRNATLQSVIDDVNRYTPRQIILADPNLANLQYTGSVKLESVGAWVLGLPAAFPLTVAIDDHGQFVLQRERTRPAIQVLTP